MGPGSARGWMGVALCVALGGCGGEPGPAAGGAAEPSSGAEQAAPRGGMEVSGLMGTIPEARIRGALEPRLPTFQRCFMEGMEQVELLGGHVKFYFRVGRDGQVEWVDTRGSSVGHRATEQCLLEAAARTRFPAPRGGDAAEFVWGFEIDNPGGMRPPVAWDEARASAALDAGRAGLAACGVDGFRYVVTAYVQPGGEVLAAGAASDSHEAAARTDCVLDQVRSWRFPDPGSYTAKVTFSVP